MVVAKGFVDLVKDNVGTFNALEFVDIEIPIHAEDHVGMAHNRLEGVKQVHFNVFGNRVCAVVAYSALR